MCLSTRYFIDNIENLVGYCKQCELHIMVTNDGAKITHVFTRNLTTTTASWESTWSIRDTRSDLGLVLEPNTNDNNMIKHLFSVGLSVGKKHYTNLFPLTVWTMVLQFTTPISTVNYVRVMKYPTTKVWFTLTKTRHGSPIISQVNTLV